MISDYYVNQIDEKDRQSFIEVAHDVNTMGIKNKDFITLMLAFKLPHLLDSSYIEIYNILDPILNFFIELEFIDYQDAVSIKKDFTSDQSCNIINFIESQVMAVKESKEADYLLNQPYGVIIYNSIFIPILNCLKKLEV